MSKIYYVCFVALLVVFLFFPNFYLSVALHGGKQEDEGGGGLFPVPAEKHGTVVKKEQRWSVVTAEDGEISSVKVSDGKNGFYHLQFITMEPNSLFLPVHLHSDMVFYVDSGNGTLSWVDLEKDEDKLKQVDLKAGDVYRLRTGSFFYLQSNLESDRRKLRINAIFSDSKEQLLEGSSFGAYSSVRDLLLGFDDKVLQAALNVDGGVIQELKSGGKQPMIVHGVSKAENVYGVHYKIMRAFLGNMPNDLIDVSKNKHKNKNKDKPYNIQEAKHDVDICNGWSLVVTSKQLKALKDSEFGVFFVNLTTGSMMGPHWNPLTAEIAVVLRGRGMVHVVCPNSLDETECKNSRFRVEEGDVFVVPRYHPMAQISFNNESFIFMGFTTTQKNNHPQYLAGTASVFQALDKRVLATSLGVSNTTMDEILSAQRESIILECTSCAEEEEMLLEEEIERQEEEKRREEEEARKREEWEEQEAKRRQEEEARRQREEEEAAAAAAKQREEEAAKKREQEEEAARQREEEAARQREKEEAAAREREQEEEAAREREQEEAAEAAAKQREQEAAARKREEEAARQQEKEEAAAREREQEEEAAREREQEEAAEAAAKQREQEAAARKREEEAARERQQEEAEAAAAEDSARQRQQEEEEAARQQKDEAARQQGQQQEAARQREQEEEAARQRGQEKAARQREQQEEAKRQREQEAAATRQRREQEDRRRQQHDREAGRGSGGGEGEAASMEEGEMARRQREAEEAARRRGGGGQGGGTFAG